MREEDWTGYNIDRFEDGASVCQIDSVGSQANRIEPWRDITQFPVETTLFHPTFANEAAVHGSQREMGHTNALSRM